MSGKTDEETPFLFNISFPSLHPAVLDGSLEEAFLSVSVPTGGILEAAHSTRKAHIRGRREGRSLVGHTECVRERQGEQRICACVHIFSGYKSPKWTEESSTVSQGAFLPVWFG